MQASAGDVDEPVLSSSSSSSSNSSTERKRNRAGLPDKQKKQIVALLTKDSTMTHEQVAQIIGCKRTQVTSYINDHKPELKNIPFLILL